MRSVAGKPLFIFLLPVFFFLHAYKQNFAPGMAWAVTTETIKFILIAALAACLFFLYFRDWKKAGLAVFFLFAFNFFFGSIHDLLKKNLAPGSLFVRYTFIIPLVLFVLVALVIYLKKSKQRFDRPVLFLNLLFSLFIIIEIAGLLPLFLQGKIRNKQSLAGSFTKCDTCASPDVYVIIADEYAGQEELQELFSFDNSRFGDELKNKGFHVINRPRSNYNFTAYSMASLFSMNYIERSSRELVTQRDMLLCRSIIDRSNTTDFFRKRGYTFYNHSFFDFAGLKKQVTNYYFFPKRKILTSETFTSRFYKEMGYHFLSKKTRAEAERNEMYRFNDLAVDSSARATSSRPGPKFVYIHFHRPHHPYYYDSSGRPDPEPQKLNPNDKDKYIGNLEYTNRQLLSLIDQLKQQAAKPPVILLASDHGFRQFPVEADQKYYFMNLCAVHLPGGNYQRFYDGMTLVNTFRGILNTEFGQQLPLLKDTSIFLREEAH